MSYQDGSVQPLLFRDLVGACFQVLHSVQQLDDDSRMHRQPIFDRRALTGAVVALSLAGLAIVIWPEVARLF